MYVARIKQLCALIGMGLIVFSGFAIMGYSLNSFDNKTNSLPSCIERTGSPLNKPTNDRINVFRENVDDVKAECVPLRVMNNDVRGNVCIYNATDDIYVSGSLKKAGAWESDILTAQALQLQAHPGAVFVDVGSQVGEFTILATSLGHDAISIDPLRTNLQLLSKSLKQNAPSKKGNATLLWNAVSDKYETVRLRVYKKNIGSTHLQHDGEPEMRGTVHAAGYTVKTILLDDLVDNFGIKNKTLIMKMDIEGSEYIALMGAYKLFQNNKVCFVSMEIEWIKKKEGLLSRVVEFMKKFGLQMFADSRLTVAVGDNFSRAGGDVFFSRSNCS